MSEEKLKEVKAAIYEIQPYFDKLNNQPSSKEILTPEEYEQYIQALLTFETVMAQLGVSSPPKVEMVPADAQEEFLKARAVLDYVNENKWGINGDNQLGLFKLIFYECNITWEIYAKI